VEPRVLEASVQQHSRRVFAVLPEVELHLTGSACLPGLDAADIDLVALVADVPQAAAVLRAVYPPLYEEQWSHDWAAFRSTGSPHVDLVLTTRGSKWDAHHRLAWDLLRTDEVLLAEYAALKVDATRYAERKREFFERVVRLLG
jgi:GrpB-like predicted nucleotidyltransferase (UPF0157 family)